MLAQTLVRHARIPGLDPLHRRGTGGINELGAQRLRLAPGARAAERIDGEEAVLVLLEGTGEVRAGDAHWPVSRRNVFEERATAVYLPPGTTLEVSAETALEALLFSAPATRRGAPAIVRPADVEVNARGRGGYSREVHNLFVTDPHAERLMIGETFNPPGHWSSFPPHKHDGRDGEPTLEEIYYYRLDPPQGFGQQMQYAADGESVTHTVRDGDLVLIPYGYHPVSAPPGYRLYYLWAMAGTERRLALFEDPAHRWIHDIAG